MNPCDEHKDFVDQLGESCGTCQAINIRLGKERIDEAYNRIEALVGMGEEQGKSLSMCEDALSKHDDRLNRLSERLARQEEYIRSLHDALEDQVGVRIKALEERTNDITRRIQRLPK